MLAKIAPRFVISGVIQSSYYAHMMSVQLVKQLPGQSTDSFYNKDPKKYFECNFFGYLSTLPKPTQFFDQFQSQKYDQAVAKLATYNQVRAIVKKIDQFVIQLRQIYRVVEANNTSSNFFSRGQETGQVLEQDLQQALHKYHEFLEKLEAYPEWKDKIVEDVGKWFHMIHNNLAESDSKRRIFASLNRQQYFV